MAKGNPFQQRLSALITAVEGDEVPDRYESGELPNARRAFSILEPLNEFTRDQFGTRSFFKLLEHATGDYDDAEDAIKDLITNALHLAAAVGYDAHKIARNALGNFEEETEIEAQEVTQ